MGNHRFEVVWKRTTESIREEALRMWEAENAIPDREEATRRAHQLVLVVRNEGGRLVGVTTAASIRPDAFGGAALWYYRSFTVATERHQGIVTEMFDRAVEELAQSHERGEDGDHLGILISYQDPVALSPRARSWFREPIWSAGGISFFYAGRDQEGNRLRLAYFPKAELPFP